MWKVKRQFEGKETVYRLENDCQIYGWWGCFSSTTFI